jgi:hypothetical protein
MNLHRIATWAGKAPALDVVPGPAGQRNRAVTAADSHERLTRLNWLPLMCAALLAFVMPAHTARAQSPNYVVQGPTITLNNCSGVCASIAYPSGSSITTSRIVEVPRGNVQFNVPVASAVPAGSYIGLKLEYQVTVTAQGPNGETTSNMATTTLTGAGSATLAIPLNVDWNESIVTYRIFLAKAYSTTVCSGKLGCKILSYDYTDNTTGPNLSAIPLGLNYSQTPPADAFLMVQTPAAAFQLPVLPMAILYSPLGNTIDAVSTLGFTETTGTNQSFSTTTGQSYGYTQDDKTTYQAGVSLVFNGNLTGLGIGPDLGTLSAGFNFSGSWDNSVETDSEYHSTSTTAVTYQQVKSFQISNTPAVSQPSLNDITYSTEPFWNDEILVLVDAQYAVWDYPASPILQPLGNAGAIELPIRALDSCISTPSAIKPSSLTPSNWSANSALPVGAFVLELSSAGDAIGAQVVTTAGTTGSSLPNWSTTNGATTADGTVVWTNESAHLFQKPSLSTLAYVWLDSPGCSAIANLDAFYAKKSQAAFPSDYSLISSIDVLTGKPNSWTNEQDSTTATTQSNTVTLTSKTASVGQNGQGVTLNLSNFLTALGLNFSSNSTSTATTVFTGQSSATLQNQTSYTGGEAESTTTCDLYSENLAVNVVQDLIFDGIAVQVPSMTFAQTTSAAVAGPLAEQKVNDSRPPVDEPAWAGYVRPKPLPPVDPAELAQARIEAASHHTEREVPQPGPGLVIIGSTK